MMNANYDKQVFSDKSIYEVILHISVMLQMKLTTMHDTMSQWHKFMKYWKQLDSKVLFDKTPEIKSSIHLLQYQITVFGIYITRLTNQRWRLTKDNIDIELNLLEEIGIHFDDLLEQRSILKKK